MSTARGQTVAPRTQCDVEGCHSLSVIGATKCRGHLAGNQLQFRKAMYQFQAPALQQSFELMLNSQDRYTLDNELALVRTCLRGVVEKCEAEKATELSPHAIAAITSLASEVARMCDTVSRIEQKYSAHVPVETLLFFIQLIGDVLSKHLEPDTVDTCMNAILDLPLPQADVNDGVGRGMRILARQVREPSSQNCEHARNTLLKDRQERIAALKKEAAELRAHIQRSEQEDVGMMSDDELAPAEPQESDE